MAVGGEGKLFLVGGLGLLGLIYGVSAVSQSRAGDRPAAELARLESHGHQSRHGGQIREIGDHYHVEAVMVGGVVRVYTLGKTPDELLPIPQSSLEGEVQSLDGRNSGAVVLKSRGGDRPGWGTTFEAAIPKGMGKSFVLSVNTPVDGKIYRARFEMGQAGASEAVHAEPEMPDAEAPAAEREIFLQPGGAYTVADIAANQSLTPSLKFREFQARHDLKTAKGDRICPITRTRANEACTWIIAGREYRFCCPPCVTEYVKKIKADPNSLKSPETFVQP